MYITGSRALKNWLITTVTRLDVLKHHYVVLLRLTRKLPLNI